MTVTRYLGTCPVCEGRFKVQDDKLVLHGYRRPGYGHVVGDCYGAHRTPHELSPETAESYLAEVAGPRRRRAERELAAFPPDKLGFRRDNGELQLLSAAEVTAYQWERALGADLRYRERELLAAQEDEQRIERWIAEWQPRPLRSIEEDERQEAQRKRERAQSVADKRKAKVADMIARYQKRIDSAVRRGNARSLADIYESAGQKLRDAVGVPITAGQALALLEREDVWREHGLFTDDRGYLWGRWTQFRHDTDPERVERDRLLSAMRRSAGDWP